MSSRMDVAVEPQTVDEAKDAVERSRQRISTTLDALEDRIVEKKHAMQDRMDVLRPVRKQVSVRPLTAVAVAVGVGALLGSLGGREHREEAGRDEKKGGRELKASRSLRGRSGLSDRDRAELREWRRMRRERLRNRIGSGRDTGDEGGRLDALKHQLAGAVTSAIGAAVTARLRDFSGGSHRGDGRY
ncbi:MAG TPA: hypothetical protein VK912_18085 [Longimicrobiales bacterium]|nr:hypothetical protein [Longimicrobiales bacterium]